MLDVRRSKISKPRSPRKAKKVTPSSAHAAKAASATLSDDSSKKRTKTKPKSQLSASEPAPTMPPITTTITTARAVPLPTLKDLASSDASLRRKSLTTALEHLDARPLDAPLTPTQPQQLWRAFYVALYMHDSKSAVSVQNLARTLAGTLRRFWAKDVLMLQQGQGGGQGLKTQEEDASWAWSAGWAAAFWDEMAREWAGIDQWRMNKVLMLVRFFVGEGVALALEGAAAAAAAATAEQGKDTGGDAWRDFVADVVALPLEVERSLPDGLRMHVLDVWGDEIEKVLGMPDDKDEDDEDGEESSSTEEHRKEVARMLTMAAKELSVFRQGEANVPRNVRARAKEIVQRSEEA